MLMMLQATLLDPGDTAVPQILHMKPHAHVHVFTHVMDSTNKKKYETGADELLESEMKLKHHSMPSSSDWEGDSVREAEFSSCC